MKFQVVFRATCTFLSTVAVALLITSCRTIPTDPNLMTCSDLDELASESVTKDKYPFFVSQLAHPGDWRTYSRTDSEIHWIKNDSRKRLRIGKNDWVEVETLHLDTATGAQEHIKDRALFEKCRRPTNSNMQLTFINADSQAKAKKTQHKVDIKGDTVNDHLARLVCGLDDYPPLNKYDQMAQKWKQCQAPASPK